MRVKPRCECGQYKTPKATACESCLYLDGPDRSCRRVMLAMYEIGGVADLYQIAFTAGLAERMAIRVIGKMVRTGRVSEVMPFGDEYTPDSGAPKQYVLVRGNGKRSGPRSTRGTA